MVPFVTRAPNITNIACWKIAPKPLVYIDPRILSNYYTFIPGKTIQDWIERYFQIPEYSQNFDVYFINRYLTVWGFTIVFPQVPLLKKLLEFFHSFVDTCIGTICHHKDFTGWVLLWENFISPRNNLFHTQRRFFSLSPNGPHLLRMVQPIRSPENPGTTVVSIGHLTPWPENPGYSTQVWDKDLYFSEIALSVITTFMSLKYSIGLSVPCIIQTILMIIMAWHWIDDWMQTWVYCPLLVV